MSNTIVRDDTGMTPSEKSEERTKTKRERIIDEFLTGSFEKAARDEHGLRKGTGYYNDYHLRIDTQKPDAGRGLVKKFLFHALGINANKFPGEVSLFDVLANDAYRDFRKKLEDYGLTMKRMSVHNTERKQETLFGHKKVPATIISINLAYANKLGF